MADSQLLAEASLEYQLKPEEFKKHELVSIQDEQNGAYTGSVSWTVKGSSLGLGERFDARGSFMVLHHRVIGSADAAGVTYPMAVAPKNGFPFLFSAKVQLGGQDVLNNSQQLNKWANYKMLSSWSVDKQKNAGSIFMFNPDDIEAGASQQLLKGLVSTAVPTDPPAYTAASTVAQNCNNRGVPEIYATEAANINTVQSNIAIGMATNVTGAVGVPVRATTTGIPTFNSGLHGRLKSCTAPGSFAGGLSAATLNAIYANTVNSALPGDGATAFANETICDWYFVYPLASVSDVFQQIGLFNCDLKLQIYYNELQAAARNAAPLLNTDQAETGESFVTTLRYGDTCPIMVTPGGADSRAATAGRKLTNLQTAMVSPNWLYLKKIELTPDQEAQIPEKRTIVYRDYQVQNLIGVTSANALQWNVTTGIPRMRELVMYISISRMGMQNQGNTPVGSCNTPQENLACTEPAHSSYNHGFTNLQIKIGTSLAFFQPTQRLIEEYMMGPQLNAVLDGTDSLVVGSQAFNWDLFRIAGIHAFDLLKMGFTKESLDGNQVELRGTLYTPGYNRAGTVLPIPMDIQAFIGHDRVVVLHKNGRVEVL